MLDFTSGADPHPAVQIRLDTSTRCGTTMCYTKLKRMRQVYYDTKDENIFASAGGLPHPLRLCAEKVNPSSQQMYINEEVSLSYAIRLYSAGYFLGLPGPFRTFGASEVGEAGSFFLALSEDSILSIR